MPTLIDSILPEYDHHERHRSRVGAPPERVWDLLFSLRVADLPTTMRLVRLRGGPSAWFGEAPEAGSLRAIDSFAPRQISAEKPTELVLGDIAKYASSTPSRPPIPRGDLDAFSAFTEEGWSKVAMNFHLEPHPDGTLVTTETRVLTYGASAKRTFALYWFMVRAGSGLIRRDLLRAIRQAA
jgi:hypothetical protein